MAQVKVTVEKSELVIRIPMQDPQPSTSGKTMVIATTRGNQKTGYILKEGQGKGKEVVLGLNAYYKPERA